MLWKNPAAIGIANLHDSTDNSNTQLSLSLLTSRVMLVMTLVTGTITVRFLPLSPMLIQSAEATTDVTTCNGFTATKVGTDKDDTIQGTGGNDVIVGLGGNDRIYGRGGIDRICGGDGDDRLFGGGGDDNLNGRLGNDDLHGDSLLGFGGENPGNDRLDGDANSDRGNGGPELDICLNVEIVTNCEA